jgi:hypothetical protein
MCRTAVYIFYIKDNFSIIFSYIISLKQNGPIATLQYYPDFYKLFTGQYPAGLFVGQADGAHKAL